MRFNKLLPLALAGCLPAFANGEEAQPEPAGSIIEEVLVIGHPLSAEGIAQASDVIAGEELERKVADSIGATVGNEPGVHNSSFGVAAGRPVIHGLDGPRVRVLEDRIDTLDVSVTSGDHAVTVDPFIVDRVEILKGSATLLYGSGAIGGVVDTHTGRIPHEVPDRITGKLDLRGETTATARAFRSASMGAWATSPGMWTASAGIRTTTRFRGMQSPRASWPWRREHDQDEDHEEDEDEDHDEDEDEDHDEDEDEDHEEEEPVQGMMPGSGLEVYGGAAGFSFVSDRGFIGVSVSRLESEYGIPGHSDAHDHGGHDEDEEEEVGHHDEDPVEDEDGDHEEDEDEDHEEEEEHGEEATPFADLKQTRIDIEAALIDPLPGFSNFNMRLGINDYEHQEVEGSGVIGAAFGNDAWEARAELTHENWSGWNGALGAQYGDRSFSVVGEEAFTPPVDTRSLGLFWVGERSFSGFQLEAGARYDRVKHKPAIGGSDSFSGASASLGAIVPLGNIWQARLLADYSTRAPVGEELYSDGPHLATNSFEIGDRDLDEEKAINLSASLDARGDRWSVHGNVYFIEFSDFIFQRATGEEEDGLDVRQFDQADATFVGLDLEARATVAVWEAGRLEVSAFYDIVDAELDVSGNDNLPRIPPQRAGLGLDLDWGNLDVNVDYVRAFKQDDVTDFELETDAYNDLRAYVGWGGDWGDTSLTVFVQGRNLTDDEQRLHTSIVKDVVPQPGRTIEAGLRVAF